MYKVTHYAYCGMSIPLLSGADYQEAKARFERRIAYFKKEFGGQVLRQGQMKAELCEPDGTMMVPDACGILEISKEEAR